MTDDDFKHARSTDPETSHAGARFARERDRAAVHAKLFDAGASGLADFELEALLGGAMNGKWRKRRSDLTDDGVAVWIKDKWRLNPATNKSQRVWCLRQFMPPEAAPLTQTRAMFPDLFGND